MENVDHLVLSGGALKGIAFLGTLECLQRRQSLDVAGLKVLVGASVGALICGLLSIGFSTAQLFKLAMDINFEELAKPEVSKILTHFGLDSGHSIVNKLKELFYVKGVDPNITFQEHHAYTGKRLVITVSCLGKGVCYFDYLSQPELSVIAAIRMSISYPGYFTAVRYKGDYYVDGGMLDNVPIAFLHNVPQSSIVVIRTSLIPTQLHSPSSEEENNLESFLWLLWLTTAREMERLRLESTSVTRDIHRRSTIQIDITPYSSPIAPTLEEKRVLLRDGYKAAIAYLQSDVWLEQRIRSLPYRAMRKVWQAVHKQRFIAALQEMKATSS